LKLVPRLLDKFGSLEIRKDEGWTLTSDLIFAPGAVAPSIPRLEVLPSKQLQNEFA
jgi:hypothetical protein